MTRRPHSARRSVVGVALLMAGCFELPPDPTRPGFFETAAADAPDQPTDVPSDGVGEPDADAADCASCPWGCRAPDRACGPPPGLVAGARLTCAGPEQGLACWGERRQGLFADGLAFPAPARYTHLDLPPPGSVGTALGDRHACAGDGDGGVHCWGANERGQLSDAAAGLPGSARPVRIGLTNVTALAAHGDWTCALRDGGIWCWGRSADGRFDEAVPTRLFGFTHAVALDVGGSHVCAMVTATAGDSGARRLWCWGANEDGQAGADPAQRAFVDPAGEVFLAADDLRGLVVGARHTCMRFANEGAIACLGANDRGQRGVAGAGGPAPIRVEAPTGPAVDLVAGDDFTCARDVVGAVSCWGANDHAQLLAADLARDEPSPVPLLVPPLRELAAGATHLCGRVAASGAILCWGDDRFGQLGRGRYGPVAARSPSAIDPPVDTGTCNDDSAVPVPEGALDPADTCRICGPLGVMEDCPFGCRERCESLRGVAVGDDHVCVLDAAGAVICWGDNTWAQLALDPRDAGDGPLRPRRVAGLEHVLALDVGADHGCAIVAGPDPAEKAQVRCWGRGDRAQLAGHDGPWVAQPVVIELTAETAPRQLAMGGDVTCALLEDRSVRCWGGDGANGLAGPVVAAPPVLEGRSVSDVRVGGDYACAVLDDGYDLVCWGEPTLACLDDFVAELHALSVREPVLPLSGLTLGARHGCFISSGSGQITCCGDNSGGAIGLGTTIAWAEPRPRQPAFAIGGLAVGAGVTCAHEADGPVYCWGENVAGLLGGHDVVPGPDPQRIGSIPAARFIDMGRDAACSIDPRGTLVRCWGDDRRGIRGHGYLGSEVGPWAEVIRQHP